MSGKRMFHLIIGGVHSTYPEAADTVILMTTIPSMRPEEPKLMELVAELIQKLITRLSPTAHRACIC